MLDIKLKEQICEFCGQVLLPKQVCECTDAKLQRQKTAAAEQAKAQVEELVPEWPEEYNDILTQGINNIIFNECKSITIEDNSGIKVKLQSQTKSFIKIDRTDTNKSSITI